MEKLNCDMLIVRVEKLSPYVYRVFYVSYNPFADGNRYPELLAEIKRDHPRYKVLLRHIRDVDGHFVTRDEYQARNKK